MICERRTSRSIPVQIEALEGRNGAGYKISSQLQIPDFEGPKDTTYGTMRALVVGLGHSVLVQSILGQR